MPRTAAIRIVLSYPTARVSNIRSTGGGEMSTAEALEYPDEPETWETADLAVAIVDLARQLASAECRWLTLLAEFDRREGWRADGQLSGVDWLVWRCGLSRNTAWERLRVAHELRRRPTVRASFAAGELSYSKVRAITRVKGADDDTDRWLLKLADSGTAADLDRVARHFEQIADQERGVDDYLRRFDRRHLRTSRTFDGMTVVELVLPTEEGEELIAHLQAVDDSPAGESSTSQRRVDALFDLLRTGRAHLATPCLAERSTVHVVASLEALADRVPNRSELLDGTPISVETLRRQSCDGALVRHLVKGDSEPLDIGRRTPVWTTAQRRAISVRDHGTCRFTGCWRQTCDAHHIVHFADGGPTAVDNGVLLCPRHHTLLHEGGFTVTGNPNAELMFFRPDGTAVTR
jgi:uncharacterized protein DUF222/HNH endonuclease